MRKTSVKPYLLLFSTLLFLMSLSKGSTEKLRGTTVAVLAPAWEQIESIKQGLLSLEDREINEEIARLQLENHLLRTELEQVKELLPHLSTGSIPARIIFRSPSTWNSSVWINVGTTDRVIRDSPVVVGTNVVGVIDYVGNHQSRVRLITDSGLTPSVRAVRTVNGELLYLAKGEIHGSSRPLWRSEGHILRGVGFNYDFPDPYGPARDLRTGEPVNDTKHSPLPIIQPGDHLVTTGMDGIFPAGLNIATVLDVDLLKEGDYCYSLTAAPAIENLNELSLVFIIPPLGYDAADEPPLILTKGEKR